MGITRRNAPITDRLSRPCAQDRETCHPVCGPGGPHDGKITEEDTPMYTTTTCWQRIVALLSVALALGKSRSKHWLIAALVSSGALLNGAPASAIVFGAPDDSGHPQVGLVVIYDDTFTPLG